MSSRRFASERTGSVSVMSALFALLLVGMAALVLDAGQFYYAKRRLQTATDIAALAAASDLSRADAAAAANIVANGFPNTTPIQIERGLYTADPSVPADGRFVIGGSGAPNAVRVTASNVSPLMFGNALTVGAGGVNIRAQAIGVSSDVGSFSLGSRLAQLDGGLLNAVLGSMLGTTVSLTLADYRSLADAKVDLFGVSDAMAVVIGLQGNATYDTLAGRSLRMDAALSGLAAALSATGGSAQATSALRSILGGLGASSSRSMTVGRLIAFGPYGSRTIGSGAPVTTRISVLDLLVGMAEIGGAGHLMQASLTSTVPGILDISLALAIGEPAVGTSFVAVGPAGASVHTAQIRLLATFRLGGSGLLSVVSLPVYIEVAQATGRIRGLVCPSGNDAADEVDLAITPGIVDAWIGAVSMSDFQSLAMPPSPGPAVLVNVAGLVTITARAHATMTNMHETIVPFSAAEIAAGAVKTTSTTDYLSSLVSNLVSSLQVNVGVAGLGLGVPPGLDRGVVAQIISDLPAIDQVLSSTLATLGITLGDADSQVQGLRCGQGFLAN